MEKTNQLSSKKRGRRRSHVYPVISDNEFIGALKALGGSTNTVLLHIKLNEVNKQLETQYSQIATGIIRVKGLELAKTGKIEVFHTSNRRSFYYKLKENT